MPFNYPSKRSTNVSYTVILEICSVQGHAERTKAVHIDLVSDLSTKAFLATLKRLLSRSEKPANMYSDNSLDFVGANNELANLVKFHRQIQCTFIIT